MPDECMYCGHGPDYELHQSRLGPWHFYAPRTLANRLKALARGFKNEARDTLLEAAARCDERYTVEEEVKIKPLSGNKVVILHLLVEGERVCGPTVILSGPPEGVDDFLDGQATLKDIEERWTGRSRR